MRAILRQALRFSADWIDLAWSHHVASLRQLAPFAHGRLLDVGCGGQPYRAIFGSFITQYLGIECFESFQLTSAAHGQARPDVLYDGARLPFADASFDTVVSLQVLEHTPRPAALVAELRRVLTGRPCLDWSERRAHLAGSLGAALARRCLDLRWVRRVDEWRTLALTPLGRRALRTWFGIQWTEPAGARARPLIPLA